MTPKERTAFRITIALLALLLAVLLAADALAMETITLLQVNAHGGLNVRQQPNTDAWIIYTLPDRETVSVLNVCDGWTLIGRNYAPLVPFGWVCSDFLR